jgi:hypothetical protein
MTGGGLYILVAYGSQNILLSGNPDFTYFYLVLKKYSHFSFESATIQFDGPGELLWDSTIQIQAKVQRIADLLSDLYLTFTLPDIYSQFVVPSTSRTAQYEFQWNRYIGAHIIQKAVFLIGGTSVQEFDSDYLTAIAQTDQDETQYAKWRQLVGDVPEIYDPANGIYSGASSSSVLRSTGLYPNVAQTLPVGTTQTNAPSIPGRQITVPLSFWFTQHSSLALPLTALQYHECYVQLTLRSVQDLFTILDPSGFRVRPGIAVSASSSQIQTGNLTYITSTKPENYLNNYLVDFGYTPPALNTWPLNAYLQATFVYLTDAERNTFSSQALTYPVRQVTTYPFPSTNSRQNLNLYTHNPVPRILILPRRSDMIVNMNNWVNFTNWYAPTSAPYSAQGAVYDISIRGSGISGLLIPGSQQDIIRQLRILCDGNEVQEVKPIQYFHEVSSWKYAAGLFPKGLTIYSFALDTSKWMKPSGTLNTSRVKNFQIDIDPWPQAADTNYTYDIMIYVESLNFLVIESGMGGMKYAT